MGLWYPRILREPRGLDLVGSEQRLFWKLLFGYWGPPELGGNLRENSCVEVTIKKL